MKTNFDTYYWQNELIRLRPATTDDWDMFYNNYFDTPARFFLDSLVELPLTEEGAKETWRIFIENIKNQGRYNFTIETLDGLKVAASVSPVSMNGTEFSGLACRSIAIKEVKDMVLPP